MALIYWTLHGISASEVGRSLSQANPLLFAAAIFCSTAIFALRAIRWRTILQPVASRVALGPLWRATAIGMMVNNVALARAGEIVFGLYALVFFPSKLLRLFELFARRVSPAAEARGRRMLGTFVEGLSVLRSPGHFAAVLGWTVAHWLLNAIGFWLAFKAVGITAPFSAALFLQAFIALGTAVPALPGFFGIFEYMSVQGLSLYGVSQQQAATWAIGYHLLTFIPITLIGAYYFAQLGVKLRDLQPATDLAR